MGLFSNQFANVVEWQEQRDDIMFWKWNNDEIKKGSKLIIRPGQDAIFMYNGKVFGTQTVKKGDKAIEPSLAPAASGSWQFDFSKPIEENTTIEWE